MWREYLQSVNLRVLFAGVLTSLIVSSFFLDEVTDYVEQRELREQNQRFRKVLNAERDDSRKVRLELLEGQDYLREQLRAIVVFVKEQGYDVPPELLAPVVTYRGSNDDDDDDDGDTTVVVPRESNDSLGSSGSGGSPPQEDDDEDLPIPLPDQAGEATDTAKRIIEDVTGMVTDQ